MRSWLCCTWSQCSFRPACILTRLIRTSKVSYDVLDNLKCQRCLRTHRLGTHADLGLLCPSVCELFFYIKYDSLFKASTEGTLLQTPVKFGYAERINKGKDEGNYKLAFREETTSSALCQNGMYMSINVKCMHRIMSCFPI